MGLAAELKSLPCGLFGPGTLHRVIAAAQKTILASGMLAVGPSPKHGGKPNAVEVRIRAKVRAKQAREA